MPIDNYSDYDGLGLAELVKNKDVTPTELAEAAIDRIERHNDDLNAVVHKAYELGRSAANDTESAGSDAPFAGVPFLLKDIGALCEGLPTAFGSSYLKDFVAPFDDELVRRYKKSGVSILGKTNAPELGLVCTTEPRLYGPACNPWNLAHSTGGSSGGSAAAVAAGIVPIAHANDGGGSIRIPASCCGLVGLKPSRARITQGPMIGEILGGLVNDHVVSRTVRDSAAMLDATAGPMPGDPYIAPSPEGSFLDAVTREPGQLRIAVCAETWQGDPIDEEVAGAVRATAKQLESLGHIVDDTYPSGLLEQMIDPFVVIWSVGATATLDPLAQFVGRPVERADVETLTWGLYERGKQYSAMEYVEAWNQMHQVGFSIGEFMNSYDIILTPTLAKLPIRNGELDTMSEDVEATFMSQTTYATYTPVFNATGQPSLSLPLQQSSSGLPIGMMFTGRYGAEETLFSLAGQLEEAMPWRERRPQVWG